MSGMQNPSPPTRPAATPKPDPRQAAANAPKQLKADFYVGPGRLGMQQASLAQEFSTLSSQATPLPELCSAWLQWLAKHLEAFDCGIVTLKTEGDKLSLPIAAWPAQPADLTGLLSLAQSALKQRQSLEMRIAGKGPSAKINSLLAVPIQIEDALYGIAVIRLLNDDAPQFARANHLMTWGLAWLTQYFWRDGYRQSTLTAEQAAFLSDLMLMTAEMPSFQEALFALVNDLTARLKLRRVSIGWLENGQMQVKAISHSAHFRQAHESVQRLARAMEEAYDQNQTIVLPGGDGPAPAPSGRLIVSDHLQLAQAEGGHAVASFLIRIPGRIVGVLTFEFEPGRQPGADEQLLGELLGSGLAALLQQKHLHERWLGGKFQKRWQAVKDGLLGNEHPVYKLATFAAALLLAALFWVQADFRITAKTVIEGLIQRAAVAPFDGYVARAEVRAGDSVRAGQVVAALDDKDLLLEQQRLTSEVAQHQRKYRDALAKHDRPAAAVLGAELQQAQAQLALVDEKLARAEIKAPFDGIVVSGDLSQKLGAPVNQGDVLFEITPLNAYRIILKVDERDISLVRPDQSGRMTLAGLSAEPLPFTVKQVTPVAAAEEGINYFRVEAEIIGDKPLLRPGMEGIGKIGVGEASLWHIWTRRLFDWLRIGLWTWLP
ncbi:efflux RND transporter periplasmic adaptor subunit [Methylomonas rhizoryzae]|uniref:efflux RND transporter periplasmic adaptor subunit n=1 Tax=Methylomonas rhizoryzae TaxID=2608981 RepID=UPI0016811911|nr:HlyD family efflux transporter periplasmic adaptor subunit [Methylomonas rhizoryzae]